MSISGKEKAAMHGRGCASPLVCMGLWGGFILRGLVV